MDTKITKPAELPERKELDQALKLYDPDAFDHTKELRIKGIELSDEYTRIDFLYRSSRKYIDGGWVNIKASTYIRPVGSQNRYTLLAAEGIPIAPLKHFFKKADVLFSYSLVFAALPKSTKSIDIIEHLAPGEYFNFFNVRYASWMTVRHPLDIERNNN